MGWEVGATIARRVPMPDEEVRDVEEVGPIELPKAEPRMLEIAEKIIEQQRGDFDPARFVNRYEQALREVSVSAKGCRWWLLPTRRRRPTL